MVEYLREQCARTIVKRAILTNRVAVLTSDIHHPSPPWSGWLGCVSTVGHRVLKRWVIEWAVGIVDRNIYYDSYLVNNYTYTVGRLIQRLLRPLLYETKRMRA